MTFENNRGEMVEPLIALAQEPWCFAPETIANLTDWQIVNVYLRPAMKRSEEMRKEMKRVESGQSPGYQPNSITSFDDVKGIDITTDLPSLEQVLDAADALGKNREEARIAWEKARKGS
jgi:hypothetical protein